MKEFGRALQTTSQATHWICPAELQRKCRDNFIDRHLRGTGGNSLLKMKKTINKKSRTLRSFFSFGVSFGFPFFTFATVVNLDDSGAREVSANVAVSTKAVASVASSDFAVEWVCALA